MVLAPVSIYITGSNPNHCRWCYAAQLRVVLPHDSTPRRGVTFNVSLEGGKIAKVTEIVDAGWCFLATKDTGPAFPRFSLET